MSIICYGSDNKILKQFYQWDTNQKMTVTGVSTTPVPLFHFCNRISREALVVTPTVNGNNITVDIPNILLQQTDSIIVYLYEVTGTDGSRTVHTIHIPVVPRQKPGDYEYIDNIEYPSYALLSARLSAALSALSEESTGDSTEVIDIRVGHDGTMYDCAGDAVRALGEELVKVQAELQEYVDTHAVDGLYYKDGMLCLTYKGEIASEPIEIGGVDSEGGASDHRLLTNRDTANQHPATAISGLDVVIQTILENTIIDGGTFDG